MNDAFYIAATGMQAQQLSVDTVANNLANLNTPGFKAARVAFQDMMQRPVQTAAAGSAVGLGVSGTVALKDFRPGPLQPTGAEYDVAISGAGFLAVALADGSRAYSRGGSLSVNKNGTLTAPGGYELKPAIQVPPGTVELTIASDGTVMARTAQGRPAQELGQLELAGFANPSGLKPLGNGLYQATDASGDALPGKPGQDGLGLLAHKQLEGSNVGMTDEMVALMLAQRAYQLNSKLIETADELMAMTNGLRR